jgi:hypothetical protein
VGSQFEEVIARRRDAAVLLEHRVPVLRLTRDAAISPFFDSAKEVAFLSTGLEAK